MTPYENIITRQSVRKYTDAPVSEEDLNKIINAAIHAPSGKNGQPWKFKVVTDKGLIEQVSALSINRRWMQVAPCLICIFLDTECSYDFIKDVQSCGAAMQNILLCAHSLGMGSCWIGDILKSEEAIKRILGISSMNLKVMGIISLGYSTGTAQQTERKPLSSFLL